MKFSTVEMSTRELPRIRESGSSVFCLVPFAVCRPLLCRQVEVLEGCIPEERSQCEWRVAYFFWVQ